MMPLMIGTTELLLIGGIALLLFGGKKLPELMRGLGQGMRSFKEGMNEMSTPEMEMDKEQPKSESTEESKNREA